MHKTTKILAALLGGGLLVIGGSPLGLVISPDLSRFWWILPLTVASVSLAILTGSLVLGGILVRRIPARFLSALYLLCCQLLAVLSLPSSLPVATAPPIWVVFAAPALLLTSASVYYRSLKYSDEEEGAATTSDGFEIAG